MRYWILYEHVSPSGSVYVVEAAKNIGSIPNSVTRCCRGEVKTLHKFRFVYEKDYKEIIE